MSTLTSEHISLPQVRPVALATGYDRRLRQYIWLYLLLIIFEGALRKWFLPFLATPLLVVRDPVAVLILYRAFLNSRHRILNAYTLPIFIVSILAFLTTFYSGHGNLFVAVFGVRIMLFHFPLIFIIGQTMNRRDVEVIGRFMLWLALPMAILIGLQYFSPQSAWVNRGVGGNLEGAGFAGANGFFRPPATFSFNNGTTLFFSLAAVFVFYFWQEPAHKAKRWVLIAATVGVIAAMPFCLSRGYIFQFGATFAFFVLASLRSGKSLRRLLILGLISPILVMLMSKLGIVQTGIETLLQRFTNASVSEGGLEGTFGDRFLGGMVRSISGAEDLPFWGSGIGLGTNVGSALLTGSRGFLLSEGEWGRLVEEMGPLLGIITILVRLLIAIHFSVKSWFNLVAGNALPWLLISFCLIHLITANWGQPTAMGFSVFTCGLVVASFNRS